MPPPNLLERAIDEAIMMKEKAEREHEKEKKKKCSDDAADVVTAAAMGCKSGMTDTLIFLVFSKQWSSIAQKYK
jgi:hypothetical protein